MGLVKTFVVMRQTRLLIRLLQVRVWMEKTLGLKPTSYLPRVTLRVFYRILNLRGMLKP